MQWLYFIKYYYLAGAERDIITILHPGPDHIILI